MATIFLIVERSHRLENESPDESSMVRLSFSEKKPHITNLYRCMWINKHQYLNVAKYGMINSYINPGILYHSWSIHSSPKLCIFIWFHMYIWIIYNTSANRKCWLLTNIICGEVVMGWWETTNMYICVYYHIFMVYTYIKPRGIYSHIIHIQ